MIVSYLLFGILVSVYSSCLFVVLVINDDLGDVFGFVVMGNSGDGVLFVGGDVFDFVGFIVCFVDGIDKYVVGDVVKVIMVFELWIGYRNVVSGGFVSSFD